MAFLWDAITFVPRTAWSFTGYLVRKVDPTNVYFSVPLGETEQQIKVRQLVENMAPNRNNNNDCGAGHVAILGSPNVGKSALANLISQVVENIPDIAAVGAATTTRTIQRHSVSFVVFLWFCLISFRSSLREVSLSISSRLPALIGVVWVRETTTNTRGTIAITRCSNNCSKDSNSRVRKRPTRSSPTAERKTCATSRQKIAQIRSLVTRNATTRHVSLLSWSVSANCQTTRVSRCLNLPRMGTEAATKSRCPRKSAFYCAH